MKIQTQFKNASLVSVVNSSIVVKDSTGREHTFTNASIVSVNNGTIIIESEWMPKKGELIKMSGNSTDCYAIFKSKDAFHLYDYGYRFIGRDDLIINEYGWNISNTSISPVTPEEQKEFDDFCKSQGKLWNKETLQWEKYKWLPEKGENYYFITDLGNIDYTKNDTFMLDPTRFDFGNCFQTRKQAKAKLEQIKKLLLEV